jgi:very-short-patch-repair endonuclease
LSAYANEKTVLVCSNNNHPVNDIFDKMAKSLSSGVGKTEKEQIVFPIMRLGNNEETKETIRKLRNIVEFANERKDIRTNDKYTQNSKNKALSGFKELRELLKKYEDRQELEDKVAKLERIKLLANVDAVSSEIDNQIKIQKEKLASSLVVNEEDVTKYAISASEDINFKTFVNYSSLAKIKKILSPSNKDLRDILAIEDDDEAVSKFNKYLKDDKNLKRFIDIFPIIVCTNISCDKLGDPKPHFDLCIMDEAGQCNVASSLIPIVRANDLLLVGDTNQLQPVTVIEMDVNDRLMQKYNIKPDYDYIHNSVLSTMLRKDKNSKSILLSYHYRCGKRIAGFVNQRFYEQQLKLLNKNDGNLLYVDVNNTYNPDARNAYVEEAKAIVDVIRKNNYQDVGIVTPFVNQAALINDMLLKERITNVRAGTIHTLQGSEKSVIIMSAALSLKTSKKTMDWIKNNHELINVAVTRAKEQLVFVGDKDAIDLLSGDEDNDIKCLSDYVFKKGDYKVQKSDVTIATDFSNNSQSEKDFFATISPYFNKRGTKWRIERNVPVRDAIKGVRADDLQAIGQKEFDVIVQASYGMFNRYFKTVVVFEIDGGEHVGSKATAARDRVKEKICSYYGIKIIRIANSQVKDYELIISLFECIIKNIKDIEDVGPQLSLLEEM